MQYSIAFLQYNIVQTHRTAVSTIELILQPTNCTTNYLQHCQILYPGLGNLYSLTGRLL
jgi:hypothetical protein